MKNEKLLLVSLKYESGLIQIKFTCHIRLIFEPRYEKTILRGFRPGPTQTRLLIGPVPVHCFSITFTATEDG